MIPKNYKKEDHPLIEYWNDKGESPNLMKHKSITPEMIKLEEWWLKRYDLNQLIASIREYNYVMGGFAPNTYLGQYKHRFDEFFRYGISKGGKKPSPFIKFIPEDGYNPRYELLKNKLNYQAFEDEGVSL